MKKILITTCILSLTIATSAFAADTYLGSVVEQQQQNIDKKVNTVVNPLINPLLNKERDIRYQKEAVADFKQKQTAQQQTFIDKNKQLIKNQKDAFEKQKGELKDIFTIN